MKQVKHSLDYQQGFCIIFCEQVDDFWEETPWMSFSKSFFWPLSTTRSSSSLSLREKTVHMLSKIHQSIIIPLNNNTFEIVFFHLYLTMVKQTLKKQFGNRASVFSYSDSTVINSVQQFVFLIQFPFFVFFLFSAQYSYMLCTFCSSHIKYGYVYKLVQIYQACVTYTTYF